jgi:hypothetical protein
MITAIFNKSNPINLVLTSLMLLFGFLLVQFITYVPLDLNSFFYKISLFILVLSSSFLTDFIVKKNKLSSQNSFVVFFFSLFYFLFWELDNDFKLLCSNFFVLLALRKIISLRTPILTSKKIFDASLWIFVASLFHFWAILFFIVLYLGIAIYASNYLKNWLIPLIALIVVFILMSAYELVVNHHFFYFKERTISTNFSQLNSNLNWFVFGFFIVITSVSVLFLPSRTRLMLQKNKLSYVLLIVTLIIAVAVFAISPYKSKETLVFLYFPLAVLFTRFFEKIKNSFIQSLLIYGILFIAVLICVLSL